MATPPDYSRTVWWRKAVMTQQLLHQAINSVLLATLKITDELSEPQAKRIRGNINVLQQASDNALHSRNVPQLRALCDEVVRLGDKVRVLLEI